MSSSYHHGDLKKALIEAGIEILSREGSAALTLRRVAREVGVSHTAPYAHFADKQALIAAIATEGYASLYQRLAEAATSYPAEPARRLVEVARAYMDFALERPAHFQATFSGIVERETDYPDYVEQSKRSLGLVKDVVSDCQQAGLLRPGDPELAAVSIWAAIHGFITLLLANQFPGNLLARYELRALLEAHVHLIIQGQIATPQGPP